MHERGGIRLLSCFFEACGTGTPWREFENKIFFEDIPFQVSPFILFEGGVYHCIYELYVLMQMHLGD